VDPVAQDLDLPRQVVGLDRLVVIGRTEVAVKRKLLR